LVVAIEGDAGTACINQLSHVRLEARLDDIFGADGIDAMVLFPWSPNAGNCSRVEHDLLALASCAKEVQVSDVAVNLWNVQSFKWVVRFSRHRSDVVATIDQGFHNMESQKTVCSGYQCLHVQSTFCQVFIDVSFNGQPDATVWSIKQSPTPSGDLLNYLFCRT